jgi:hypothetical protein
MSDIDITRDAEIILTCPACGLMRQLPRNWRNHLGSLAADRDGHLRCSSGHEPVVMTEPTDPALVARLTGIQFGIEISDEASCAIAAAVLGCHDGEMSVDHLVADEVWGRAPVDRLREHLRWELARAVLAAGKVMTALPSETVERTGGSDPMPFCRKITLRVPVRTP